METITRLDIKGFHGHDLPNTFISRTPDTHRLAVLFPGRGYTCAMPVLYYPSRWLGYAGANVLTIEYGFTREGRGVSHLSEEELLRWLAADATAALETALATGRYSEVVLVGKSLGTLALAQIALNPPAGCPEPAYVWLTPLFQKPFLREAVLNSRPRSLFIQGDADPLYDAAAFATLQAAVSAQTLIIPGADHSLELGLDFGAALAAQREVLDALARFTAW